MCVIHHQSLFPFPVSPWFPSLMSRSLFGCGVIRVLKSNLAQSQVYALNHPPGENKSSQGNDNQFKKWDDHSQSAISPASRVDMVLGLCPFKRPPIQLTSAWFPQLGFFLQNKIDLLCVSNCPLWGAGLWAHESLPSRACGSTALSRSGPHPRPLLHDLVHMYRGLSCMCLFCVHTGVL